MMREIKFYRETNFKEDVTIGKIPTEWDIVKLGDKSVSEIIMGQSPPSSTYNKEGIGLSFLQGKMEFGDIYPSPTVYCSEPIKIAEPNDVLFSVRAPVGDVNLAPCKLCIGRGLAAIRFNKQIANHLFYFYYLQKIKSYLEALGKGSTFKAVDKDDLENLRLPLPSLKEQERIVEVLSVVDLAVGKVDEVIAKTERLKKGLMQELLTKGIGHKEYKQTPIGKIPKEWKVTKLDDIIIRLKRGPSKQTNEKGLGVVYLTSDYITDDGFVNFENLKFLDENLVDDVNKYLIEPNDLLVNCVNSFDKIGKVAVFEGYSKRTIVGFNNFALTIEPNVNPFFLKYVLLQDRYKVIFRSIGKAAVQQVSFSSKDLSRVEVPIPPSSSEQEKIVEGLSAIDKKLRIEKNEKVRLERIKHGLMDLLLTGKVRVKVN